MRWRRVALAGVWAAILVVVLWLAILAVRDIRRKEQEAARKAALEQVWKAMQEYAATTPGNYYPRRSAQPGVFLPDLEEWAKALPNSPEFEKARQTLTDSNERPLCYLGYAFETEGGALNLLDALEKDPLSMRGGGPADAPRSKTGDASRIEAVGFLPLREKAELAFFRESDFHGDPPSAFEAVEFRLPILWEMPRGTHDRVRVVYMGGAVLQQEYPGRYPMSPLFINRLRKLEGLPQDPDFREDAAILPIIRKVLEASRKDLYSGSGSLISFDLEPSIPMGRSRGYSAKFEGGEFVLVPEDSTGMPMPATTVIPLPRPWYSDRTPQYMGAGLGYRWYGNASYPVYRFLRDELGLIGGESLYPAAVVHFRFVGWEGLFQPNSLKTEREPDSGRPRTLVDYVRGYVLSRQDQGQAIAEDIIDAAAVLNAVRQEGYAPIVRPAVGVQEEAKRQLLAASKSDPEAVATLILPYVLPEHPHVGRRGDATPDGLALLQQFPQDAVLRVVERVSREVQYPHDAEPCRRLLQTLREVGGSQ